MNSKGNIWMILLGLLTLVGVGAWIYQFINGLGVTGMNNVVSWGLYITMFMFFVGLSAGGLIVSSSATVFNIPAFKVVAKPAVILSTVCIILAGTFILVDIGSPERVLNLIIHAQFKSPLVWDVIVIGLYLIVNLVYLSQMVKANPDQKKLKVISSVALPVAVLVHSVTAWIFGLQIARVGWHSALMAPLFVASALDSGLALLILSLLLLDKFNAFKVEKKLITSLAGLLVTCVAIDAFFVFSEVLTMLYPTDEGVMQVLGLMVSGATAPFFWGEIILGFVLPLAVLLFAKNREKTNLVVFSSILVVLGVFFKRIWLLFSSFVFPGVEGAPGVTIGKFTPGADPAFGTDIWMLHGSYFPTLIEATIVVGILSFGILLFMILARNILVKETAGNNLSANKEAVSN